MTATISFTATERFREQLCAMASTERRTLAAMARTLVEEAMESRNGKTERKTKRGKAS